MHEAGFEDEKDNDHGYEAHDQNAPQEAVSISNSAERCI
jgi:hypothetical protein